MQPQSREWSIRYLAGFVGLVLVWAVENYLVQATAFDLPPTNFHPLAFAVVRLGFDLLAATIVLLILSRRWLLFVILVDFTISAVVLPYTKYFHHSLILKGTIETMEEGWRVVPVALLVVPPEIWLGLLSALCLKVAWMYRLTPQPVRFRLQTAGICAFLALGLIFVLQFTTFLLASLRYERSNRMVYAYGYINTWVGQLFLSSNPKVGLKGLQELQKVSPDHLSSKEKAWPIGDKIAVIQMESICWNVLDYKVGGKEIAPFLSGMARAGRLFKVQAYHDLNSADMDYAVLSSGTPSPTMVSFEVPGITFPNALPRFMQEHGYRTASFHGNAGTFFKRRMNYEKMGFDEIWFREDFKGRPIQLSSWGVRDGDLFNLSSQEMRASPGKEFHFIITLDTHAPFNLIDEQQEEIYPHNNGWGESYFNSIRVLDNNLRNYVESLPDGAMVILYGDHTAGVNFGNFHSAREWPAEFVPCIVYVNRPKTPWPIRPDPAIHMNKNLRIHDVINIVRHQLSEK